ncbi:hypothetical protein [Streptomyces sp. NPDC088766]|uniref:hypothetical protein n=1 Tax=Streptomyces sp. NPDC088766 TaxID=3365893 RepID=UPI0037FEAE4F
MNIELVVESAPAGSDSLSRAACLSLADVLFAGLLHAEAPAEGASSSHRDNVVNTPEQFAHGY